MTTSTISQDPFKFTQAKLEALEPAASKYQVRDTEQPGLICIVHPKGKKYPEGRKVLQVYRRPKGNQAPARVNVCILGELPMTALKGQPSVRSEVDRILAALREGTNPNETRREEQAEAREQQQADQVAEITLGKAFADYTSTKVLRPRSLAVYKLALRSLADWQDRPLRAITGPLAVTRFSELAKASPSTAARALRVLSAVHRFATDFYGPDDGGLPFGRNPVETVNRVMKGWSRSKVRTGRLRVEDLRPWLAAVRWLPEDPTRGEGARAALFFELLLLTGLRLREAGWMRWADVNLRGGLMTVRETKNHHDHTLPITRRVREILDARKAADPGAEFVFGWDVVRWQLARVERKSGIKITPHGLRRSWAIFADKAGLGAYAIKAALNHRSTGDVTGTHYAQIDTDDLRPLMQRVEDHILRLAEPPADNVVALRVGGGR